jgi:hypothetical protein
MDAPSKRAIAREYDVNEGAIKKGVGQVRANPRMICLNV